LNEDVVDLPDISFVAEHDEDKKVNVRVFFIDLSKHDKSIMKLYEAVEECVAERQTESVV
jgi:5-methylcytosine-specific restriction enzyme subunit McrC